MFERFTPRSRAVVIAANHEATSRSLPTIDPVQLLVGLLGESEGVAGQLLRDFGVTLEALRLLEAAPDSLPMANTPFSPPAKEALTHALRAAVDRGDSYIAPEHILLGLLRIDEEAALDIFEHLGVDTVALRKSLLSQLDPSTPPPAPASDLVSLATALAAKVHDYEIQPTSSNRSALASALHSSLVAQLALAHRFDISVNEVLDAYPPQERKIPTLDVRLTNTFSGRVVLHSSTPCLAVVGFSKPIALTRYVEALGAYAAQWVQGLSDLPEHAGARDIALYVLSLVDNRYALEQWVESQL